MPIVADSVDPTDLGMQQLPFRFARRHGIVITHSTDDTVHQVSVTHKNDLKLHVIAEVSRFLGQRPIFQRVSANEFDQLLASTYADSDENSKHIIDELEILENLDLLAKSMPEPDDLLDQEDEAPIIRLINSLMAQALRIGASDIHFETYEQTVQVRFRVDGVLRDIESLQSQLSPQIVSRIKVMSKLDIAEKRVPQDGRTSIRIGGREIDIRVSVLPTANGERVVLRLLEKSAQRLHLTGLGMNAEILSQVQSCVSYPHGIFVVTGPTGSGKTTTLYASLSEMPTHELNVLTVEDPIEYNLKGISQTQVNVRTGLTFARGLRAILRQDPNVIMVGEIRDLETAEIAIQAGLTGHLVLSTLHTNSAIGTITRLIDMGIEPYLVATSLIGVLAQRLVRVLCTECREPAAATSMERDFLGFDQSDTVYHANGCEHCEYTGYKGRTGIYELITFDDNMRQIIHEMKSEQELAQYARERFPNITADGREKVLSGVTTVSEVLRATVEA